MGQKLQFDARGRITIPKKLREGLGDNLYAVRTPRGLVIKPVATSFDLPLPAAEVSGDDAAIDEV